VEWQRYYDERDWTAIESWWRSSEDRTALSELYAQLQRDVPKRTLHNGVEIYEESVKAKEAPAEWRGAAEILEIGELEAKVLGDPLSDPEIWADQVSKLRVELETLAKEPEVTEGDALLSRRAHAERALEAIHMIDETIRFRTLLYKPEEQPQLLEFLANIAINAMRVGYFAKAAETKAIEVDAVRGRKTITSAAVGGRTLAASARPKTEQTLSKMRTLIEEKRLSVSRAAATAFKQGFGSSPEANRKLWGRQANK
jgi:hypothetical protein